MTVQRNPHSDVLPAISPAPPDQRRQNWLPLARRAWITLAGLLMVLFVASIPVAYQTSLTVCALPDSSQCPIGQLTLGNVQALSQLHLSVAAYVDFTLAAFVAVSLLYWVVGVLIFWRASRDWVGYFYSILLVAVGASAQVAGLVAGFAVTASTPLLLQFLVAVSGVIAFTPAVVILLLTFPTGRLTPRWSGLLILLYIGVNVLPGSPYPAVNAVVAVAWIPTYIAIAGVQYYRYRRVYDAVQRQQTKWFVFAISIGFSFSLIYLAPIALVPSLSAPDSWYQLFNFLPGLLLLVVLLLSVGIAILRYRLWDVDVLINRALVYASLTALLVALYFGLVVALQALVRTLTGSLTQQPLVLVASTLAIAALFQPLRRRLQTDDRRPVLPPQVRRGAGRGRLQLHACARKWTWTSCASSWSPSFRTRCSRQASCSGRVPDRSRRSTTPVS